MDRTVPPDVSRWLENQVMRSVMTDEFGKEIGYAKLFFTYDHTHADPRYRKLMRRCIVFYAFGVEAVMKCWNEYVEDTNGKIYEIDRCALLIDRKTDTWAIGMPNELPKEKIEHDGNGDVVSLALFLKITEGDRSIRIANPHR